MAAPLPTAWSGDWVVALPLKGLQRAKSRILLPPGLRASLALSMALDTASAALRCPLVSAVVGICGDDVAAQALDELGCRIVMDRDEDGLNEALSGMRASVEAVAPTSGFASLVADLPALRSDELAAALDEAGRHGRAFVPDAAGTGTTLLAALPGTEYAPSYGPASADRHRQSGAVPLALTAENSLRRDIDTLTDLAAASEGGVGPRTRRLLSVVLDSAGRGDGAGCEPTGGGSLPRERTPN